MKTWICKTCGAHYADSVAAPSNCKICDDDRQYVPQSGQAWLAYEATVESHSNVIFSEEPDLIGIGTLPSIAIGQRALLVQTPQANILWDCVPIIDDATVALINGLGGIAAIALSHPHFYTGIVEWSRAFDDVPVYIHANDREWVTRSCDAIQFWEGERLELLDGVTVVNCGGHFPGSSVLHWATGAEGRGVLLTGDTIYPQSHRRNVTFMYSYPNTIPLPAHAVEQVVARLDGLAYDRIYAGWRGTMIDKGAMQVVRDSAEKYITIISG